MVKKEKKEKRAKKERKERKEKKSKKASPFKSIKGFIRGGKSKREQEEESAQEVSFDTSTFAGQSSDGLLSTDHVVQPVTTTSLEHQIQRDFNQPPAKTTSESKDGPLEGIVLLMEPTLNRFEFLQLEFDSHKATVQHVLDQIPLSVTENCIKEQVYTGVCNKHALPKLPPALLNGFCKGGVEVLVGIPESVPTQTIYHLARPVLSDDKVQKLVRRSKSWNTAMKFLTYQLINLPMLNDS